MKRLTSKGFKTWLNDHESDDCVGYSSWSTECPLVLYAEHASGEKGVYITGQCIHYPNGRTDPLPVWAFLVMKKIDTRPPRSPVFTHEALSILNEISFRYGSRHER